jgi:hypothetical protein
MSDFTHVLKGMIGLNVVNLFGYGILTEGIAILYIKFKGLFEIARDGDTKVVDWSFS